MTKIKSLFENSWINIKIVFFAISILFSCSQLVPFSVNDVSLINNYEFNDESRLFQVDLNSALSEGITVPTKRQINEGVFNFSFTLNNSKYPKYYYKIYYQNADYKYPEKNPDGSYNALAAENFYGSWEDNELGFKSVEAKYSNLIQVKDQFRIVGNPRNEQKYFGKPYSDQRIQPHQITEVIQRIKNSDEWFESIRNKANDRKVSLDEQLYLDAQWVILSERNVGNSNNRWKRNPRMGRYEALLVVTNPKTIEELPMQIRNISIPGEDGIFINPFYYFLHGEGSKLKDTYVFHLPNLITLKAYLDPSQGVYVNPNEYGSKYDPKYTCSTCNESDKSFYQALYEEKITLPDATQQISSIPLVKDLSGDDYTMENYLHALTQFDSSLFTPQTIHYGSEPCRALALRENYIELRNLGANSTENPEKRNVGLKTRIGFTYGKITAKVKFPSLLNKSGVWNGLTNAVWLLYQDNDKWNNRRTSKSGYTEKGSFSPDAPRVPELSYSEIDFEIVKTTPHWPVECYKKNNSFLNKDAKMNRDVVVALTNWDLCNKDPKHYFYGIDTIRMGKNLYEAMRWTDYYQALTIRHPENNDELFDRDFYYFQIEWKPGEIIWRIGADKNKLRQIGSMNDEYTAIPNNQMIMVITQEYHMSRWWPPIPFKQEYIPFPKNDIVGKVFGIEIE
jgi:hypothetical protein